MSVSAVSHSSSNPHFSVEPRDLSQVSAVAEAVLGAVSGIPKGVYLSEVDAARFSERVKTCGEYKYVLLPQESRFIVWKGEENAETITVKNKKGLLPSEKLQSAAERFIEKKAYMDAKLREKALDAIERVTTAKDATPEDERLYKEALAKERGLTPRDVGHADEGLSGCSPEQVALAEAAVSSVRDLDQEERLSEHVQDHLDRIVINFSKKTIAAHVDFSGARDSADAHVLNLPWNESLKVRERAQIVTLRTAEATERPSGSLTRLAPSPEEETPSLLRHSDSVDSLDSAASGARSDDSGATTLTGSSDHVDVDLAELEDAPPALDPLPLSTLGTAENEVAQQLGVLIKAEDMPPSAVPVIPAEEPAPAAAFNNNILKFESPDVLAVVRVPVVPDEDKGSVLVVSRPEVALGLAHLDADAATGQETVVTLGTAAANLASGLSGMVGEALPDNNSGAAPTEDGATPAPLNTNIQRFESPDVLAVVQVPVMLDEDKGSVLVVNQPERAVSAADDDDASSTTSLHIINTNIDTEFDSDATAVNNDVAILADVEDDDFDMMRAVEESLEYGEFDLEKSPIPFYVPCPNYKPPIEPVGEGKLEEEDEFIYEVDRQETSVLNSCQQVVISTLGLPTGHNKTRGERFKQGVLKLVHFEKARKGLQLHREAGTKVHYTGLDHITNHEDADKIAAYLIRKHFVKDAPETDASAIADHIAADLINDRTLYEYETEVEYDVDEINPVVDSLEFTPDQLDLTYDEIREALAS